MRQSLNREAELIVSCCLGPHKVELCLSKRRVAYQRLLVRSNAVLFTNERPPA